ncbi:transcriptional activator spt7 [Cordyceps javanica]|uniref:SAGA complex subunit Spt7 n=1 Tax=Cordyceps javanica TaxID=43265 RepID=A0A545VB83_9HYPO|nr:transcriptional activator spt7 [Cordyceps javanica]TQW10208.1 transcriptional activator spt7 [Cordyceps javanica]
MSFPNGQPAWPSPALHHSNSNRSLQHLDDASARTSTPVDNSIAPVPELTLDAEEEARRAHFADLYRKTESRVALLFSENGAYNRAAIESLRRLPVASAVTLPATTDHEPIKEPPMKKARRAIDEDDYDDDDDEDDDSAPAAVPKTQATMIANPLLSPSKSGSSPVHSMNSPAKTLDKSKPQEASLAKDATEESEIKNLEEARKATEAAARQSFHTIMYTLENDRTAMLEQQQLEDSEKQLQAEMDHNSQGGAGGNQNANQGTLSSANLGASSLTLKHLIARIDMKRDQVQATDAELRVLMNEVRKNRSKWASEENVNQEDLYEALEKVLTELKAHTEYSTPFLTRVNKRDAPDYYTMIKNPMDLGSMTKKLKSLTYKSKNDFVADLNLIWDNCLKYNHDMNHPLRRMANGMRKEAEKLIPLIPNLAIRSRAEVEAEERRKQNGGEDDGGDDSDDEPIMSSRGRKAGTKGTGNKSRTAPSDEQKEDTPVVDQKPVIQLNGLLGKHGREGSEVDGSNGFSTPPIGNLTPNGANGQSGLGSNADAMEIDGPSLNGMTLNQTFGEANEQVYEDEEYKIWKQTTKKDRALAAKERFQIFKDNKLNADAPALLRNKASMRRFLKHQKEAEALGYGQDFSEASAVAAKEVGSKASETLAEGIDEETDKIMPDYYDSLSNIPDIPVKLQWIEDGEGQVINQHEDFLRLVPPGLFTAPHSRFTKKMDDNIRQIQETRKLATKISVIKQMQVQAQVYSNQFPKSNNEPFVEQDIEPHFISDDGPVMAADACQNALKRSVGKILYNCGFEEFQPSAVDALTGIASDYFQKLIRTVNIYREAEKKSVETNEGTIVQPRFTAEEVILHTLDENGHDIASLELYAKDDVDRLTSRLSTLHERMKMHLSDLLRPALSADAGNDGVGAFKDGSDQFTSGDFADELGEDFFGFKALGLDKEMGLDSFAVPFHLLQSRVHSQYQMQTQNAGSTSLDMFETLPPSEPVTTDTIQHHIGLVKNFFLAKLHANGDQPLVEDEDLPTKQRKPRPRLGASGKIMSAQKRPPREQIALAKKKKKLEAQAAEARLNAEKAGGGAGGAAGAAGLMKKKLSMSNGTSVVPPPPNPAVMALAPAMERADSMQSATDKDDTIGMMSPESIAQ